MEIEGLRKFGKSMLPVKKGRWNLKRRGAGDLGERLRENSSKTLKEYALCWVM